MKTQKKTIISYALLILMGGCFAYFKAHSVMSLIVSALAGVALLSCGFLLNVRSQTALYTAIAIIIGLDVFFIYRFLNAMKFFPSGMMSLVSFVTLLILTLTLAKRRVDSA